MPNQELLKYIQDSLAHNIAKGEIERALLQAGWAESDIATAFLTTEGVATPVAQVEYTPQSEPVPIVQQTPQYSASSFAQPAQVNVQPSTSHSTLLRVTGSIIVALLVAGGIAIWAVMNNKGEVVLEKATENVVSIPTEKSIEENKPIVVESKQMITASKTIIPPGGGNVLTINKYPQDAVLWSMRLVCPPGVSVMMQAFAPDGDTLVGEVIMCNNEVVLSKGAYANYPHSITFGMRPIDQVLVEKIVTIVSKTFTSEGGLLNQSSLPIIVQVSTLENIFTPDLLNSRLPAELYYDRNGSSYAGVCTKTTGILDAKNKLANISKSVVCRDSQDAWAISVQSEYATSQYHCLDSTGALVIRNVAITTTSCK